MENRPQCTIEQTKDIPNSFEKWLISEELDRNFETRECTNFVSKDNIERYWKLLSRSLFLRITHTLIPLVSWSRTTVKKKRKKKTFARIFCMTQFCLSYNFLFSMLSSRLVSLIFFFFISFGCVIKMLGVVCCKQNHCPWREKICQERRMIIRDGTKPGNWLNKFEWKC